MVNATSRRFYALERPGTRCTGGWVGPRTGLDGCRKSLPPTGFDPRNVQPVASRYTDWAIATLSRSKQPLIVKINFKRLVFYLLEGRFEIRRFLWCTAQKVKAVQSLESLGTFRPTTQRHILYSWLRASRLHVNKFQRDATVCRRPCTAKLLYMFRLSIAPTIRSTSNCNCSFWYRSYHVSEQEPSASVAFRPRWRKFLALTREWYFLSAYAILRSIPNKIGGVTALAISIEI